MSNVIETGFFRTIDVNETRRELEALRLKASNEAITEQLLNAIEHGSLPTSTFAAWLSVCKTPNVVERSLRQKSSVHIRYLGIEQLKSGLASAQWKEFWDGLGGTSDLLNIFSDLSVWEVRYACKAIGRSARVGDVDSKRAYITELFQGLHPGSFPNARSKMTDSRPLSKYYQVLVPSCTEEVVNRVTSEEEKGKWQFVRERQLLQQHSRSLGRTALDSLFQGQSPDAKNKERLKALSTQFPTSTTPEPGFSASMAFALDLLREVTTTGSTHVEDVWVVENLIRPLLRRGVRKRISWSRMHEITGLTLLYLEQHRGAAKTVTNAKGDVLHMIALCWSRRSTLFEQALRSFLKIVFHSMSRLEDFEDLLTGAPRSRRFSLLHFCCQEVTGVDLDDGDLDLQKVQGPLTPGLLDSIGPPHALRLFGRLRNARGDAGLVELGHYNSVLVTTRTLDVYEGDPDLYYLVLLNRNGMYGDAESHAASILEARKKTTRTSYNRETRAEHALSAWACANASGSLKLLSETLQWAKSFVRDQLTAVKLFSTYYDETYKLLSGFLIHSNQNLRPQELRQRVKHANAIMIDLLDIAYSALREPFFKATDWRSTINVFTRVVEERIKNYLAVKKEMGASDDDMYHALWEDTIATLIQAEKLANEEEHEKLGANTVAGVVSGLTVVTGSDAKIDEKATWMFLDNLAKARNQLWTQLRPARYPDVLTLPEPFPRGLPVQFLLASGIPNVTDLSRFAPYISSRVEAAVFVHPDVALKPVSADDPTQKAIGVFVDSYKYALGAYIPDACDPQEKERRLKKVWDHATGPLSDRRMNYEEASRFWKNSVPYHLQSILSGILPEREHVPWPVVPTTDDPSVTQEWDPLEGRPADVNIKVRKLGKATYIDYSLLSGQYKPNIRSEYHLPVPQVPAESSSVGSIWGYHSTAAEQEAGALAALLYLDAKYSSTTRILTTPFPSQEDIRYPCLYLDESFLSRDEIRVPDAAAYLSSHISLIPVRLFHGIAATLVGRFNSKQNPPTLEQAAFSLIGALSERNNPGLAFGLAIQVIIGQPSASSWHRLLFHNGFLQRLSASDARSCIEKFAEAIGEKINEQKRDAKAKADKNKVDDASQALREGAPQRNQAFVKITTLKSLAQVLNGSMYIGDDVSLKILSNLSSKISHVDVRLSILQTLLSKLDISRPELWEHVILALEAFIPLAGSLDEREPMTEDDWARAEETLEIPKIQLTTKKSWQEDSPMLNALLGYYLKLDGTALLDTYLERVILPLVQTLKQQTVRWSALFLKKYAFEDSTTLLPPVPRGITILEQILTKACKRSHLLPRTLLDEYMAYLLYRITPTEAICALNKGLTDDPAVKSKPEVATWLELYGNGVENQWLHRFPFTRIANFGDEENTDGSLYVTHQLYQKRWLEIFSAFLWADAPNYNQLKVFVSTLTNPYSLSQPWWNAYGRSTIEAMLAYVNSIRTRDWEADRSRKPAVLPDTFYWTLSLLSYPLNSLCRENDEVREQACKTFAEELSALIKRISHSMYHTKFAQIKGRICKSKSITNTEFNSNLLLSALYLGDISKTRLSWLTTPDLLRVDLAANIVSDMKGTDIGTLEPRLKAMLESWITNENEEVRRTGYRIQRELFDADGTWKQKG
ncbi:hypothetical protein EJ07DRAFT_128193 [Lizonia empirigonia]|nr:hypothetical protein EJ07DRAFT_128193 [Lizonia empirigonia]